MMFHPKNGKPEEITVRDKSLYSGEITDMHNAILEGKQNYLTLDDTKNHVRTVLALYESARFEKIVRL